MIKCFFVILLSVLAGNVFSSGVPELVELTPDNSKDLGFELKEAYSGDDKVRMVIFTFPKTTHGNWVAKRVQLSLLDSTGDEVMGASSDYVVTDEAPSVMAHYQPGNYDMAIMVQYFCKVKGCVEAYSVRSVTHYLTRKK
ncbi:hypothetical protein FM037_05000 [Shewanella psychropiezotolerans]|uniref:Uncharacterized protein n=1 Tax=Shewanella psychropiezotolerans TaxID=2593655 RepID=A0ABX5WUC4_9GAMM|nr:hypothetical protein [Shewanella psychropiezotolerans]QDO82710.1 hypothetical protein FM037_05000 [Shewanella psychropiezotolerans]